MNSQIVSRERGKNRSEKQRERLVMFWQQFPMIYSIVLEVKAGSNYADKGDKSLDKQMDASMAYRKSAGSISVTTVEAMEKKVWQKSIFLDRGKNRINRSS